MWLEFLQQRQKIRDVFSTCVEIISRLPHNSVSPRFGSPICHMCAVARPNFFPGRQLIFTAVNSTTRGRQQERLQRLQARPFQKRTLVLTKSSAPSTSQELKPLVAKTPTLYAPDPTVSDAIFDTNWKENKADSEDLVMRRSRRSVSCADQHVTDFLGEKGNNRTYK